VRGCAKPSVSHCGFRQTPLIAIDTWPGLLGTLALLELTIIPPGKKRHAWMSDACIAVYKVPGCIEIESMKATGFLCLSDIVINAVEPPVTEVKSKWQTYRSVS